MITPNKSKQTVMIRSVILTLGLMLMFSGVYISVQADEPTLKVETIQQLILDFANEGAFANDQAVQALTLHVKAMELFEANGAVDKMLAHLEGFKVLLHQQRMNELITEQAYQALIADTNALMALYQDQNQEQETENLIANSGFESGDTTPTDWSFLNVNTNGSWALITDSPYEGARSLKLSTSATSDRMIIDQKYIPIESNQKYRYGVHYRTENMVGFGFIRIQWYSSDNASSYISGSQMILPRSADWTNASLEAIAPENAQFAYVKVEVAGGSGDLYLDQLELLAMNDSIITPVTATFDKNPDVREDVSVTLALNGNTLEEIQHNSTALIPDVDYAVSGEQIVFLKEYLTTLPEGTNSFLFVMNQHANPEFFLEVVDSSAPAAANLVPNPDFENGATSPNDWRFTAANTNGTWVWDETASFSGDKSVKLTSPGPTDRAIVQTSYIPVEELETYEFSFYHKTEEMAGQPFASISWFNEAQTAIVGYTSVLAAKDAPQWRKTGRNFIAPEDAAYALIQLQTGTGSGTVWYDRIMLKKMTVSPGSEAPYSEIKNKSFELGNTSPESWTFQNDQTEGSYHWDSAVSHTGEKSIRLQTESADDIAYVEQLPLAVNEGKTYRLEAAYLGSDFSGSAFLKLYWFQQDGTFIRSDEISGGSVAAWTPIKMDVVSPLGAARAVIHAGLTDGTGQIWLDDVDLQQILVNADGVPIDVWDVEDVNEPLPPAEFWGKMNAISLNPPADSMWTEPVLRDFYFGSTEHELASAIKFTLPQYVRNRDNTVPVLQESLGVPLDPANPVAIGADLPFNPLVRGHGTYSEKYYPRNLQEFLIQYNPAYVLSGDPSFKTRAEELIAFLDYSQWKEDGSNQFVKDFFPEDYELHPEWYGGWDYLFDFEWRDGYGYEWSLHEPDHHMNGNIASMMVNSYELYGDEEYLNMARDFVYNQIPRYGFHKGTWKDEVYYWTEYSPTGASAGHAIDDATNNVIALVAASVAKVGYYESDPVLKQQLLDYARGLLWYMVREFETNGRWYYDGAENHLSSRKSISHDTASFLPNYVTLAYLYKAGVDVDSLLEGFESVHEAYIDLWAALERKTYMKVAKLYDGTPAPNETTTFSTFVQVTTSDLKHMRYQDAIPEGFTVPGSLDIRFSKVVPPSKGSTNWTIDPSHDVVLTVTPEQLADGIEVPFPMDKWSVYKITYDVTAKPDFDRTTAVNTHAGLSGWTLNEEQHAAFVNATTHTTGSAGVGSDGYLMPLREDLQVNSKNLLSFGAHILFPTFTEEMAAELIEPAAPTAVPYIEISPWPDFDYPDIERYTYSAQSLIPNVSSSSGATLASAEDTMDKGKIYRSSKVGDYVEFEMDTLPYSAVYDVYGNVLKANDRGIVRFSINGNVLGEVDLYHFSTRSSLESDVPLGSIELPRGTHKLKIEVIGQHPSSNGYRIGLYDALVLVPTAVEQDPIETISLESIQEKLDGYISTGDVMKPLTNQLQNRLRQAGHHHAKGNHKQAIKSLDDALKHMNNKAYAGKIAAPVKEVLQTDIDLLKTKWSISE